MSSCCLQGFNWKGKPEGKEGKLAKNDAYIVGSNKDVAVLVRTQNVSVMSCDGM